MYHKKTYYETTLETPNGDLTIEGPVEPDKLEAYDFHQDLIAFRPSKQQHKAIVEIAQLPEGRIIIARHDNCIVGYVTFLHPDPLERWSEGNMENLLELGAIEVIPEFRHFHVGEQMLAVSMKDDAMEDYIILTTEYYWHWDLKGTKLSVWDYRRLLEKVMNKAGLLWYATDDPEINSHPANCLMVRVGKRVDNESMQQFDRIRFHNRFMY